MNETNTTTYGYLIRERQSSLHGNRNCHGMSKTVHVIVNGRPLCSPRDIGLESEGKREADVTCKRCKSLL